MTFAHRAGTFVAEHPVLIAVTFGALLAGSVPVMVGVEVYLSIYELSPRGEYYDHFVVLNRDLGWDNLAAVLMTLPDDKRSSMNVTDPAAVRHMHAVGEAIEELEFVEGTFSLATLVEILNGRPYYVADQSLPGGLPNPPPPLPQPRDELAGFPRDDPQGNHTINMSLALALDERLPLRDQVYGNILAPDHKSALLVVVMETGATGEEYRAWQERILEVGLALDADESLPYPDTLELRPLSVDIIYSTLDNVALEEGPFWIAAALVVALATVIYLFRRTADTLSALVVLVVVVAITLSTATLRGVHFNLLSLLVAALIFAAGVDYSMHVLARYREERRLGYESRRALLHTCRASGPALLITSITTTAGFASLYFSLIPAIGDFGIMVGVSIFAAFIVCMSLLPVLLVWTDRLRGDTGGSDEPEAVIEARRERLEQEERARQRRTPLGRMGAAMARRPAVVVAMSALAFLAVASPLLTHGVTVWGASYLEPYTIFDEETYPMQALRAMDATFGIPNELAVLFYGDATDPVVVKHLDEVQRRTEDVHGRTKTDSVPNVLRLYTTFINPDPRIDRDRDGLPDTREDIKAAYDTMRRDPATAILLSRVVVYKPGVENDYPVAAHRLGVNPQPPNTLGTDVENYRQSYADTQRELRGVAQPQQSLGLAVGTTGLVVLAVEVVDAIVRGNAMSVVVMLAVVYAVLLLFWRRPVVAAIGMVPVVAAVLTQYSLTSFLGYEVTYVSLILTGMVMGIGVDDAVHYINRFREEMRHGRSPDAAATLASAEIGSVLVGTTLTTMAPFFVLLFSVVTWAAQTALLVLPTLLAALFATLFTVPALLAWHARVRPATYSTPTPPERIATEAEAAAEAYLMR